MKKFMKLFPVALAAIALASCTERDLLGAENADFQQDPSKLYVTVEDMGDATRAGFVEGVKTTGYLSRVTVFQPNDIIKIYDDTQDWRPQTWKYEGTIDAKYTNGAGLNVFTNQSSATQYTSGYGVYPATYFDGVDDVKFGEFTNEDRTAMKFDFDVLRTIDYEAAKPSNLGADAGIYGDENSTAYYGPRPMWGVATSGKMTLKYLTAYLRIDVTNVIPAGVNQRRWLLVQSDQTLTGEFTAEGIEPDDATTGLTHAAPVLVGEPVDPSVEVLNAWPVDGTASGNNTILVDLGRAGGVNEGVSGGKPLVIYVPIAAGKSEDPAEAVTHTFNVYLSAAVPVANNVVDFTAGQEIAAGVVKVAGRGETYNIIDDTNNTDGGIATTPYLLAQAIMQADASANRDFTFNITKPVKVKNTDASTQNYQCFITTPLKHNVTVNLTLDEDVDGAGELSKLFIQLAEGSKKLTLNLAHTKTSEKVDEIVIDQNVKAPLVLVDKNSADPTELPVKMIRINDNPGKLTIKCNADDVVAKNSVVNVDGMAEDIKTIKKLTVQNGTQQVNLLNGNLTEIAFGTGEDQIAADLNVYSTGMSAIQKVTRNNIPVWGVGKPKFTVNFTSQWDGSTYADEASALLDGVNNTGELYTAAQLATANLSTIVTYTIMGDMDMQGAEADFDWTPKAATNNIVGYNKGSQKWTSATAQAETAYPTISNLDAPFLGVVTVGENLTIENFKISGSTFTAAVDNMGILGNQLKISAAKNVVIDNVDIASSTINCSTEVKSFGGLFGIVNSTAAGNVTVKAVNVTGLNITGNAQLGGLIGYLNDNNGDWFIGGNKTAGANWAEGELCEVDNPTFGIVETAGVNYDPWYGSIGTFVGRVKTKASGNVIIAVPATPNKENYLFTIATASQSVFEHAAWGKTDAGKTTYYNVVRGQNLVGFSDNSNGNAVKFATPTADSKVAVSSKWATYQTNVYAEGGGTQYISYINSATVLP